MNVNAFGLAAGWKLCAKMRFVPSLHIVFRARNWNPRKSNEMIGKSPRRFASLWCDTSTPQGELLVTILAGFANVERHLIKARTDDGRKRAKARGVRFGRDRASWIRTSGKRCSGSPMAKHWST